MTVLRMSVQAGLMVIAVVFLRVIALGKLPKNTFLVLWGLVLARMLIPLSVPFKWSVFNLLHVPFGNATPSPAAGSQRLYLPEAAAVRNPAPLISWLLPVWLGGMLLFLSVFMIVILRSYRRLRFAVPFENEIIGDWLSDHRLRRPLRILQSDRIHIPLAIGIVQPRIIFPTAPTFDRPEKIRFVLEHEFFHIRRFDMLRKLLALAAVCVHWFNPLGWLMLRLLNRDLEITCDDLVLQRFGGGNAVKKAYAFSLIEMEAQKNSNSPVYNFFSNNATSERVKMIVNNKKISVWAVILAVVLVTVSVLTLATAAHPSETDNMAAGDDGLTSIYGRVIGVYGSVIEVQTLDVQTDGDRITDWRVYDYLFRLGHNSTEVTDSDGNSLNLSSITDVIAGIHPHTVTVWYDPENLGEEAPLLIKAAAVRVESVRMD